MEEIIPVPKLDIDALLFPNGEQMRAVCAIDRAVVFALLLHLERAGFTATSVHDGEEEIPVKSHKEVMELCFNIDDARVYFKDAAGKDVGSVLLIFGNDGWDAVCDWSYKNEGDAFSTAMDAFEPEKAVVMGVLGVSNG